MKKNKKKIYKIENISEEQMTVIMRSLNTFSRLGILQLENAILEEIKFDNDYNYFNVSKEIDYHLNEIKILLVSNHSKSEVNDLKNYRPPHWSFGIASENTNERSKLAYEMYKSLSHKKWLDNPDTLKFKYSTVDSDEGLKITTVPRIKVISESERIVKIKSILD